MTIAPAAPASVPSLPSTAAARPSADSGGDSGSQFAEQLNGFTGSDTPAAAAPRVTPAKAPKKAEENAAVQQVVPQTATPLPLLVHLTSIHPGMESLHGRTGKATNSQQDSSKLPSDSTGDAAQAALAAAANTSAPVIAPQLPVELPGSGDDALAPSQAPAPVAKTPATRPETPETVKPTVSAAAPEQPKEMAFAARVQPVENVDNSALPAEMASTAAVASASKKVVDATEEAAASPLLAAPTATTGHTSEPAPAQSAPAVAAPTRAETPVADTQPKTTAPLKDISLQVSQPGRDQVNVRVIQTGGEVHVSVHSGDSTLTSGLRQGLSELQTRLEENGYRSEMWRPGAATAPVAQTASPQASTNHSRGGDGQPQQQQGGSQQDGNRRNQNQSNQPRWVEELQSSLGGGQQPSGGFYGFTR